MHTMQRTGGDDEQDDGKQHLQRDSFLKAPLVVIYFGKNGPMGNE